MNEPRSGHVPLLIAVGTVLAVIGLILMIVGSVQYQNFSIVNGHLESGIVQMYWGVVLLVSGVVALLIALGVAALRWKAPVPVLLKPGETFLENLKDQR